MIAKLFLHCKTGIYQKPFFSVYDTEKSKVENGSVSYAVCQSRIYLWMPCFYLLVPAFHSLGDRVLAFPMILIAKLSVLSPAGIILGGNDYFVGPPCSP